MDRRSRGFVGLLAALALLAAAPLTAWAAPDLTFVSVVNEDDGFPGVCAAPCFSVQKTADVFFAVNPTGPGVCGAGQNTYLYKLTHLGGSVNPAPPVNRFELNVDFTLVSSAGFIPGPGIAPNSTTVSPLNIVSWEFMAPPIFQGQASTQLFLCSPAPPGAPGQTLVSVGGGPLDAPGECIGPVQGCDLQVDKTCCIPQPPIPAGDICEGKSIRAVFEVVDGKCADTTNFQNGEAKCSGPNPIVNPVLDTVSVAFRNASDGAEMPVTPSSGLAVGDTFEITSVNPTLRNQLKLLVTGPGGSQNVEIHASCSQSLRCNDQFGSLRLVELETTLGGTTVCNAPASPTAGTQCVQPPGPGGTPCDSKLVEATFKFTPSNCQSATFQNGAGSCAGDASDTNLPVSVTYTGKDPAKISVIPAAGIGSGETFKVVATGRDELHSNTPLLIADNDSVEQSLSIHTSCSAPLACGDVFGSLKLVAFKTKNGLTVDCDTQPGPIFQNACEVPLAPPTPHCTGKLESLTLVYLKELFGANCSLSNPQNGKASCSGANLNGDDVSITILTDPSKISADPNADIDEKGLFTITKVENNQKKELPSEIQFTATDGNANSQTVKIHTSCSQPLNLGDRFGDFAVFAMDRGDGDNADSDSDTDGEDGLISLGGLIEYQYKVTNPNPTGVVNVAVLDDPHGTIVTGESLAAGEMKTFFATRTLFETVVNKALVTAEDAGGAECTAAMDQLTVTVTLPPPGSFDCSAAKPINELSMEWGGLQNVRIRAWKGNVGSTLLKDQDNIVPGTVVKVTGLGGSPNDQVWEVFQAGTLTKIGESKFHISCSDPDMNGIEDCGKNEGNGKDNTASLINAWLFEGMKGNGKTLSCTPVVIPPGGGGGSCGLGFELVLLLPGLLWLRRRRSARAS